MATGLRTWTSDRRANSDCLTSRLSSPIEGEDAVLWVQGPVPLPGAPETKTPTPRNRLLVLL